MQTESGNKHRKLSTGFRGGRGLVSIMLLMLAAQFLAACTGGQTVNEEPNTVAGEETAGSATVDEILGNPNDFYGEEATVTGRVTEVITPLAFELNGERNEETASSRYGEGADGLLVVKDTPQAPAPELTVGQTVEVSGMVRSFDTGEVEDQIGEELVASLFTYWASRPSVVATSIEPVGDTTSGTTASE